MSLKNKGKKARILLAKIGFDGHDRGIKIIAAVLRDAGYEVLYMGKYLTAESVVKAAVDEDVDAIGLSFLQGSHVVYSKEVVELIKENGIEEVLLIVGGVIPYKDVVKLKEIGVNAIFPANTITREIVQFLDKNLKKRNRQ
jgi:methylmalonyl-CoA mutase C-terminal domain/subunit